jgi:two-component system sensor histidine kinase KdpD
VKRTQRKNTVLRPTRRDYLVIVGLIGVTVLVLLSTFLAPDPASFFRDRYDILGILLVSVVASWRGTRAGVLFALIVFLPLLFIGVTESSFAPDSADLVVDLLVFLGIALVQGMQTGHLRQREIVAEENERRTSLLSRLSERLVPAGSSSVLHECLGELRDLMNTDRASLFLADPEGELVVQAPDDAEWFAERPQAMGLVSRAFAQCAEWNGPDSCRPAQGDTAGRERGSGAAVALAAPGGPLGVLYVSGPESGGYSAIELDFLGIAAEVITAYLERERLQAAMSAATAAEAASRLKSSLVSSVSHELKTPLSAATATVTGLLEKGVVSDEETRCELSSAIEDLHMLDERIGDLLEVSRLEATGWQPNLDWNDPADVCSSVLSRVPAARRSRIHCRLPSGLPIARFDLVQITHALYHLVENALAYSPPDAPVILSDSSDAQFIRFSVEDSGPGVGEEERGFIFEKFQRGSAGLLVGGGTGLGLTIASEIVRYHGGRILLEDVQPHGSRFVIELPRES